MSNVATNSQSKSKLASVFKRFLRDSSGQLTAMMGLSVIPILFTAGAAIDVVRVTREQAAFYGAVDAAAVAIAADTRSSLLGLSTEQVETRRVLLENYAKDFIKKNYVDASGGKSVITTKLTVTGAEVKIAATLDFPTTIMALTGITKFTLKSNATVKKAARPIELTMVLDTTGSMKDDMSGLQSAANKLLASLYGDSGSTKNMSSEYIRTSLVPFSAAVRLDTAGSEFDWNWIDTTGTNPLSHINFTDPTWNNYMAWGKLKTGSSTPLVWNGCVEARKQGTGAANYIIEDVAPSSTDVDSKFPAFFNPDSPSFFSTSSNTTKYPVATSSSYSTSTGSWQNNYIGTAHDFTITANASTGPYPDLLAPSGSAKTGYDDSGLGNYLALSGTTTAARQPQVDANFQARFKNQAKYDGKIISAETYTQNSDLSWSVPAGPWSGCTASKVVPMTYDRSKVEAGITSMKARGGTNIADGLAWGRRVISPGAPFTTVKGVGSIPDATISPYKDVRWNKVLVLMSDGLNDPYFRYSNPYGSNDADSYRAVMTDTGTGYNSLGYVNTPTTGNLNRYGSTNFDAADNTLDSYTTALCDKLKADGVTIYAVSFKVTSPLLQSCATSPDHFKQANDTVTLNAFFDSIGETMNKSIYVSN